MKRSQRILAGIVLSALGIFIPHPVNASEDWFSIGPFGTPLVNDDVISGQTNVVAIHPHDANTLYIGAAEGGIWRTTDAGAHWEPLTDTQLVRRQSNGAMKGTLSIGTLAIHPENPRIIYAGTGEPHVACDSLFGPALGVFRSNDAGDNWTPLGADLSKCDNAAMGSAIVNRIMVLPGGPLILAPVERAAAAAVRPPIVRPPLRPTQVLAATNMGLFLYKEDGTDCWTRLTNGLPVSGDADDLIVDPYQHVLYVAFDSQGIFKSTDMSGAQWKPLTQGLPQPPAPPAGATFGWIALAFGGRTGIGFSQPLPLVYAGYNFNGTYRLFKTVNGGDAWTELPSPPSEQQIEFNDAIAVGSYDSNQVYVGQVALWRATDGGAKGGLNNFKVDPPVTDNSWTNLSCCQVQTTNPARQGMDLHADTHDIEFAPYGSFMPTPEQVELVYVANDGGLARGRINSDGVVTWDSLTKGLAIGQNGTIGLDPNNPGVTTSGVWHNGDLLTLSNFNESLPMAGGDGFQSTVDAGNLITYVNCNAGFGGAICRLLPPAPFFTKFKSETIWSDNKTLAHWADPHRPGNLLRLQKDSGQLFRTTVADTATAATLNTPDVWQAIEPPGKTGKTITIAFRSRVLEETPVYYLGTDSGQVWRGSPEAGWTKLCECGAPINAIAADLFRNERIFVVLKGPTSPGRIKEIVKLASGSWQVSDIDANFKPDLQVDTVACVAVDPTIPATQGTTIYVGTDQGMFCGQLDPPLVLDPGRIASFVTRPPQFGDWTWRRSPGVPNVRVMDLEVQQNFQGHDHSGIVRAGTYGRGIFELRHLFLQKGGRELARTLTVQAMEIGEDGAPSPLSVTIPVASKAEKVNRETPFELPATTGTEVSLEAPRELRQANGVFRFVGWTGLEKGAGPNTRITVKLDKAAKAVAYYEKEKTIPEANAQPLHVSLSTSARQVCARSFSHELTISWDASDGQPPLTIRAEISFPDKHSESVELKAISGARPIPMNYPGGGEIRVKLVAQDSGKQTATADSSVTIKPCPK